MVNLNISFPRASQYEIALKNAVSRAGSRDVDLAGRNQRLIADLKTILGLVQQLRGMPGSGAGGTTGATTSVVAGAAAGSFAAGSIASAHAKIYAAASNINKSVTDWQKEVNKLPYNELMTSLDDTTFFEKGFGPLANMVSHDTTAFLNAVAPINAKYAAAKAGRVRTMVRSAVRGVGSVANKLGAAADKIGIRKAMKIGRKLLRPGSTGLPLVVGALVEGDTEDMVNTSFDVATIASAGNPLLMAAVIAAKGVYKHADRIAQTTKRMAHGGHQSTPLYSAGWSQMFSEADIPAHGGNAFTRWATAVYGYNTSAHDQRMDAAVAAGMLRRSWWYAAFPLFTNKHWKIGDEVKVAASRARAQGLFTSNDAEAAAITTVMSMDKKYTAEQRIKVLGAYAALDHPGPTYKFEDVVRERKARAKGGV